ncbi:hypothetical protein KUCAC02_005371, partial [Chaenocephalus aceratus]
SRISHGLAVKLIKEHLLEGRQKGQLCGIVEFLFKPEPEDREGSTTVEDFLCGAKDPPPKDFNSHRYLLRRLRSFGVQGALLQTFYDSCGISHIASISAADRKRLNRLVKKASSVLRSLLHNVEEGVNR